MLVLLINIAVALLILWLIGYVLSLMPIPSEIRIAILILIVLAAALYLSREGTLLHS
jgi:hypothetical protein